MLVYLYEDVKIESELTYIARSDQTKSSISLNQWWRCRLILTLFATLLNIHKDPFDRLLLAQAITEGFILLTANEVFSSGSRSNTSGLNLQLVIYRM